jgi:hypothetical protein
MKNVFSICILLILAVLAGCSKSGGPPASVIRVTVGNKAGADDLVTTALTSFGFAQHADEVLGLAKKWGVPAAEADERIRAAISVRKGKQPDLFVVAATGLDHDTAVQIVNELCTYYASHHQSVSIEGGPAAAVTVAVVEPAK